MQNRWNETEAAKSGDDRLAMRVYSSRLLGSEPDLVLFGGGNTSVKDTTEDILGRTIEVLYVKGSGWDLATIEPEGFPAVELQTAIALAELPELSDRDMVRTLRAAMVNPDSPSPSVETILHAVIPFDFVDHTHADAVVTVTNTENGEDRIREIYGDRVLIVPYVMPGFILAKTVYDLTRNAKWDELDAIILMNHGVFTFSDDARTAYTMMIDIVTEAENYLDCHTTVVSSTASAEDRGTFEPLTFAALRKQISTAADAAMLARASTDADSVAFSTASDIKSAATRGPLTPDHVIRTKRIPVVVDDDSGLSVDAYTRAYSTYFEAHTDGELTQLDPAPRWALWPGVGTAAFGRTPKDIMIIGDIVSHTATAILKAEELGGWHPLPAKDIFEVEYWELEQAKLRRAGTPAPYQGRIAVVTGAAAGIGRATVDRLRQDGAVVAALDIRDDITTMFDDSGILGLRCDVRDTEQVTTAVHELVHHFGGLDMLVSNAGNFPPSCTIAEMNREVWQRSMELNLTSHQLLLQACAPYLKLGYDPGVVFIVSKNSPAPGPGAAAYSVAKAGLTQLGRIAAMELGEFGIRVNMIHPNAVFDTDLWNDDVITQRAAHYGISAETYRSNNVLKMEVLSQHVADMASAMLGSAFARTTGAQVPVDGGNERVI